MCSATSSKPYKETVPTNSSLHSTFSTVSTTRGSDRDAHSTLRLRRPEQRRNKHKNTQKITKLQNYKASVLTHFFFSQSLLPMNLPKTASTRIKPRTLETLLLFQTTLEHNELHSCHYQSSFWTFQLLKS